MPGLLDNRNEDVTMTRKLGNGASVTYKSPQGSQMDFNGLLGGMVDGHAPSPVADNRQISVTPGEFVVNQPAAQKYKPLLEQINQEGRRALAQGGWVGEAKPMGYANGGQVSKSREEEFAAIRQDPQAHIRWMMDYGLSYDEAVLTMITVLFPGGVTDEQGMQVERLVAPIYGVEPKGPFGNVQPAEGWQEDVSNELAADDALEELKFDLQEGSANPEEEARWIEEFMSNPGELEEYLGGPVTPNMTKWLGGRLNNLRGQLGKKNFWTGGEVGKGDPEEGDTAPTIKGGGGVVFRNGQWVYGKSGKPVQEWLMTRITDSIQPLIEEGEAMLEGEGASLGNTQMPMTKPDCPEKAPMAAPTQGYWTGGEVGKGDPEEGDTAPQVNGGQGVVFKDGQWVYAGSGNPVQSWLMNRINEAIQPIVAEGEAAGEQPPVVSAEDQSIAASTAPSASDAAGVKLNEGEGKNYGWANRAISAEKHIREIEARGFNPSGAGLARQNLLNWIIDGVLPGDQKQIDFLRSEDAQRYKRAVEAFVAATLRKDTGAQISPTEYERTLTEFFPSFGSTKKTRQQLADHRLNAIDAFIASSGPASEQLREKEASIPTYEQLEQDAIITGEDIGGLIGTGLGAGAGALATKSPVGTTAGATAGEQAGSALGRLWDRWWTGNKDDETVIEALKPSGQDAADALLTAGGSGLLSGGKKLVTAGKNVAKKKGWLEEDAVDLLKKDIIDKTGSRTIARLFGNIPEDIAAKFANHTPVTFKGKPYFFNRNTKQIVDAYTGKKVHARTARNIRAEIEDQLPDPKFAQGGAVKRGLLR